MNFASVRLNIRYRMLASLVGGTLDILAAFTWAFLSSSTPPGTVLKFIASGYFGPVRAFSGNAWMAYYGLFFHFAIAFLWTNLLFTLYKPLHRHNVNLLLSSTFFGLVIWSVMNLIVLPLTRIPTTPFRFKGIVIGILILIVAMGLPIAFAAKQFYKRSPGTDRRA